MSDLNVTTGIFLIPKQNFCFVQKTVTEVEISHLSVSSNNITSPTIKGMCIDEDVECFKKSLLEVDKVDKVIYSGSNLPRMNVKNVLVEDMTGNISSEDLKPLTHEGQRSFGKVLEREVGVEEFANPVSTYLCETSKPVMKDLRSLVDNGYLAEDCYSGETSAGKIPSEKIIDPKTNFCQEFDSDFLQVDSSTPEDIDNSQDPRQHFVQVTKQDEKSTMVSPTKENSQIEETINKDLFEESKSSFSVITDIKSGMLDSVEGASYDVKCETGDIPIAGNVSEVVSNQQNVHKRNDAAVEDPIIDSTASARSSFTRLILEESSFSGAASLLGPVASSGHIPYSGNISHRSDSSTTSTQSFAFPILQSEWNSSPVKMAKADRRRLRKHRWRTMLICCKF